MQEILTVKSDDVVGRVKVYESIIKGQEINQAGVPESFRVLMKEFQALGLDVSIINDEGETLQLKEIEEAEDREDLNMNIEEVESPAKEIVTSQTEETEEYSDDNESDYDDSYDEDSEDDDFENEDEEGADI